tara:strand:+ start:1629 stop:1892 length:264 start_codon:yes stop_codon:yes gene_type:complete
MHNDISKLDYLLHKINKPVVCTKCSEEFIQSASDARSLQEYTKLDVGFSDRGFQVWCRRHELNVCHFNFNGNVPEVDFRCLEKKSQK